MSSRCAFSRCTWAAGGTISERTPVTREPSSLISSMTRSPSRLILAVNRLGHPGEHLLAHDLTVEQGHVEDGDSGEGPLDLDLVAVMDALPFLKKLVVQLVGQQPVDDHRIRHVAEQAEVRVGA